MKTPDRADLVRAALRALSVKERSRAELRARLLRKSEDAALVDDVLDELVSRGILDDARAAGAYSRERAARGFGPAAVRAGLRRRGLEGATENAVSRTEMEDMAFRVARKKSGGRAPADAKEKARLLRFLAGRGFSESCARAAVRRLSGDQSDDGIDETD